MAAKAEKRHEELVEIRNELYKLLRETMNAYQHINKLLSEEQERGNTVPVHEEEHLKKVAVEIKALAIKEKAGATIVDKELKKMQDELKSIRDKLKKFTKHL